MSESFGTTLGLDWLNYFPSTNLVFKKKSWLKQLKMSCNTPQRMLFFNKHLVGWKMFSIRINNAWTNVRV